MLRPARGSAKVRATVTGDSDRTPGTQLTLGEPLGQGAVATVVRVTDEHGHVFAGKILHASHGLDPAARARFRQEAALSQQVVHDNVVRVYGRRLVDEQDVLLMELVDGPDLATFIARHRDVPPPPAVVLKILHGIASGLAAAHAAGVVHRDLKVANILVAQAASPEPVAKIADFGMARATSMSNVGTDVMTMVGTPDTMAPECMDPLAVDGRTDLYALGCIAFELLSGAPPYRAATPFGVIAAHRDAAIPELPATAPAGDALRVLVRSLLAKSPADRPQAAAAVRDRLAQIAQGQGSALALLGTDPSRCARCSGPLVPGLAVCLGCGMAIVVLRPGQHTVIVVGPGEIGDKLDAALRDRLVAWLQQNPATGLAPTAALAKRIPRLPFVLAKNVAGDSAAALCESLNALGITAQALEGRAWSLPAMRTKAKQVGIRAAAIAAGSLAPFIGNMINHPFVIAAFAVGAATIIGANASGSFRPAAKPSGRDTLALPAAVRDALARVQTAAPGIEHARHREALRAVVARTVALAAPDQGAPDPAIAQELANGIDAAIAATGRLDALDRRLTATAIAESTDATRGLLHERDLWSARLLRLAATLETLAIRQAAARAQAGAANDDAALGELRDRVEALEEVFGS